MDENDVKASQNYQKKDRIRTQTSVKSFFPPTEKFFCKVTVDKERLRDSILEMLTVNGRPFQLLEDSGFSRAFGSIMTACGLVLNPKNVKDHIHQKRLQIDQHIQSFKSRLVSLKVDCVTRLDQSFIGINLQLIENDEIKVFTCTTVTLFDD